MNKVQYNQISEKLFETYLDIKFKNLITDEEDLDFNNQKNSELNDFVKDLEIDDKVVMLFESLSDNYHNGFAILKAIKAFFPLPQELVILPEMSIAERGRLFAIQSHRDVDQLYGEDRSEAPYEYHLWSSVQFFKKYKHHIPKEDQDTVEAAQWNHDVVEDGQKTFNDLKNATNETVAKIACAVTTNVHGHNRKARADEDYYNRIRSTKYAAFVKLCDRLANVSNGGKMVDGYRKEMPGFLASLGEEILQYQDMIDELNSLVKK